MNKIISEGIEAATEVADKIKECKNRGAGFPYKTVLITLGIGAILGYALANMDTSTKKD